MDASSDVPQLWVALTPEQWNALDTGALPDENSGRFGLRTTAAEVGGFGGGRESKGQESGWRGF